MANKKFELTGNTKIWCGRTLYQIKALISFGIVSAGELGGHVEKETNVSEDGNAWVFGDAWVSGNAQVSGDARVYGDAQVSGNAQVMWFSKVGSENGTLTAYYSKTKEIIVTRGCFIGTIDEFERKVKEVHAGKKTEKEYLILIDYIKTRFAE